MEMMEYGRGSSQSVLVWDLMHQLLQVWLCAYLFVCVCVFVSVRVCLYVCVCVCVWGVCAKFSNIRSTLTLNMP